MTSNRLKQHKLGMQFILVAALAMVLNSNSSASDIGPININVVFTSGGSNLYNVINITKGGRVIIINNGDGSAGSGTKGCSGNRVGASRTAREAQIGGVRQYNHICNAANRFRGTGSAQYASNQLKINVTEYNNGTDRTQNDYVLNIDNGTCSGYLTTSYDWTTANLDYRVTACNVRRGLSD